MVFPSTDAYWQSTADFLLQHWNREAKLIGPNEFMDHFPGNCPLRLLGRQNPETLDALVLHKGMLDEMSPEHLTPYLIKWKPVFANEVFVVLAPPTTRISPAKNFQKHVQPLFNKAEALSARTSSLPAKHGKTVILVTTYNRPASLERTLEGVIKLDAPILIVDDGSDTSWDIAYRDIQKQFPVQMIRLPQNRGLPHALNCGLSHWLADPEVEWISYFQDDVEVRSDTLEVLSRFQDAVKQPILSGRFSDIHQVINREKRDGIELVYQRMCPGIHLHAHRGYWEKVMPIPTPYLGAPKKNSARPGQGADEDWWITCWAPLSIAKTGGAVCVVPGLVRTFSSEAEQSSWNNPGVFDAGLNPVPSLSKKCNAAHWWPAMARHFGEQKESEVHPHAPAERAGSYHSIDDSSTELEVLQFLAALICLFKPRNVLETGAYRGFGSLTIASALDLNGFGRLTSIECEPARIADSQKHVATFDPRLLDRIHFTNDFSLSFLERYQGPAFDFCFLDSALEWRMEEFFTLRRRNLLADGAVVMFHDTSPLRPEGIPGGGAETFLGREKFEELRQTFDFLEFPYSRGFILLRHRAHHWSSNSVSGP